jgi:hypothetical protein
LNSAVKAARKPDFVASASAGPSSAASSSTTVSQADENRLPRDLTANLSGSVPSEAGVSVIASPTR